MCMVGSQEDHCAQCNSHPLLVLQAAGVVLSSEANGVTGSSSDGSRSVYVGNTALTFKRDHMQVGCSVHGCLKRPVALKLHSGIGQMFAAVKVTCGSSVRRASQRSAHNASHSGGHSRVCSC